MPRDIDQLIAALSDAFPGITVEQRRSADTELEDESRWHVNHPDALLAVQLQSATGDAPFLVESDVAPPTKAATVDRAVRLVRERLGLSVRPA